MNDIKEKIDVTQLKKYKQKLNQTDFGRIFYNQPKETKEPHTTEELAHILKHYHKLGRKVTIRNTGHSVNGQTLTKGTQVNIQNIKHISFKEEAREVKIGAGITWDEVLRGIHFPKYCLPVFPNEPGQQIKVSGTASVGGLGPYNSKYGGLWHHIKSLTLVTMTGEIIKCSPKKNADFFKFALGGFGRIGVISELTMEVLPSNKNILLMGLFYHNSKEYLKDLGRMAHDSNLDAVIPQLQLSGTKILQKIGIHPESLVIIKDIDKNSDISEFVDYIKNEYHDDFIIFAKEKNHSNAEIDVTQNFVTMPKRDFVYFYPKYYKENQLKLYHPWSTFILDRKHYPLFMEEAEKIIYKYNMQKYLMKESVLHNLITADIFISYVLKNIFNNKEFFPLSLDLPQEKDYALAPNILPSVPLEKIKEGIAMTKELTNLAYELKGKQYLCGLHSLSQNQVEKHFGKNIIKKWQKIKDELDPNHLLNIGVIEHLDTK